MLSPGDILIDNSSRRREAFSNFACFFCQSVTVTMCSEAAACFTAEKRGHGPNSTSACSECFFEFPFQLSSLVAFFDELLLAAFQDP